METKGKMVLITLLWLWVYLCPYNDPLLMHLLIMVCSWGSNLRV